MDENSVNEADKLETVTEFIDSGHLLEIGPGIGLFAYAAKRHGFNVTAYEMDSECVHFLRTVVGVNAIQSENVGKLLLDNDEQFDIAALWHVIEHLPNPLNVLSALAKAVRTGGFVAISSPNPDAAQFALMRRLWPHLDAPRHLFLIPLPVLTRYMESIGFELVHKTTSDHEARKWNAFSWQWFLTRRFINHKALRFDNEVSLNFRIRRRLASVLNRVMSRIDMREGWGSTYTAVYRKVGPDALFRTDTN